MIESKIVSVEFEFTIQAKPENVWRCLTQEINQWWRDDFRVLGAESIVSLEAEAGKALKELGVDGSSLEWYRVQMCNVGQSLYLVGYLAKDWGGPSQSMLKLSLKAQGDQCLFSVSDAITGNVGNNTASNVLSGWKSMFEDSFRRYVESQ